LDKDDILDEMAHIRAQLHKLACKLNAEGQEEVQDNLFTAVNWINTASSKLEEM